MQISPCRGVRGRNVIERQEPETDGGRFNFRLVHSKSQNNVEKQTRLMIYYRVV